VQYGELRAELDKIAQDEKVKIFDWPDFDQKNDLESLAALVKNLDLVISINSFAAYLANAVGTRVLMLCHRGFKACWPTVFVEDPEYPQITYLRQNHSGDWEELFRRAQAEVQKLVLQSLKIQ
jgi:ADP-heptose:LPS heptosyltransferase